MEYALHALPDNEQFVKCVCIANLKKKMTEIQQQRHQLFTLMSLTLT